MMMKSRIGMLGILLLLACPSALCAQIVPDQPTTKLDEIGLYTVGYAYRGQKEQFFPPGWSGYFEDKTGVACEPTGEQNGKQAFLLHCPWRNGTGVTFQEFVFRLPIVKRIVLTGATAMRADSVGKSDGATFRLYANGRKLLDENRTDAAWKPFTFDLTAYGGHVLTLRFETDPGPRNDPSFDFSLWGDRMLTLEGYAPKPITHPAPLPLDLARLTATGTDRVAPIGGFDGHSDWFLRGNEAVLRYSGPDGTLEYRWKLPQTPEDPPLGLLSLHAERKGDAAVSIPVATNARLDWTQAAQPQPAHWTQRMNGLCFVRPYRVGNETATLSVVGRLVGKSLMLEIACNRPLLTALDAGGWGPILRRRSVPIPYYSGRIFYLPHEDLFVNAFLDWTASGASSEDNTRADYGALTDGSRNFLRERVFYTAAWHMAEVLPNPPNPPSPYRKQIGDRIVLDIWGGNFTGIAKQFETLADYGITHCLALVHVWQRSGYDNALPAHIPANAEQGGDAGMKTLVATGTRLGYLVALHENYVDYYPNYDHFNPNDIALNSDGQRELAWFNPGTKIQSFAVKPTAILPLAATQSPEIHRRYGTNADYLDVHSAVPPWFHVDFRAGEDGAGTLGRVWDVHRQLWDYERKTHGGPVFGEGANHWYWSGCLDGVEAQFGVGWPSNQGLTAPLMVDFDLLRIHPLQFNHGMGYYERWWTGASWGAIPPMVVLDQYRMQEVAYGHAGFLGAATWSVLPLAWLEHHLLSPVTARYATARPESIAYEVEGKWVDGTAAAKAGQWQRVRVRYDNGLTVTANNADAVLRVGDVVLPRFGWLAQGAGVTAWTALRDGVVADYAETPDSVFANARNAADWNLTGLAHIRPEVATFAQTGARSLRFAYRWQVGQTLPRNYVSFVHFGQPKDGQEGILFQQDHPPSVPTTQWKPGTTVTDGPYDLKLPADLPDGDYVWSIGLFAPDEGRRLNLEGVDDGTGRIRLGRLQVREGGKTITFEPERAAGDARLMLYQAHLNTTGKVVDFGAIRTNGSVHVWREGADWVAQTLPRDADFALEFRADRFGSPARVRCLGGKAAEVEPERRAGWWRLPLNGAREYRWPAR